MIIRIDLTNDEAILLLNIVSEVIEYGHGIRKTRNLINIFDKLKNSLEENNINE